MRRPSTAATIAAFLLSYLCLHASKGVAHQAFIYDALSEFSGSQGGTTGVWRYQYEQGGIHDMTWGTGYASCWWGSDPWDVENGYAWFGPLEPGGYFCMPSIAKPNIGTALVLHPGRIGNGAGYSTVVTWTAPISASSLTVTVRCQKPAALGCGFGDGARIELRRNSSVIRCDTIPVGDFSEHILTATVPASVHDVFQFVTNVLDGNNCDLYFFNVSVTDAPPPPIDIVPPSVIADLTVSDIGRDYASLLWTAPGDDGSIGTAAKYRIRYATFPITDASWASASFVPVPPTPLPAGSRQVVTIGGLTSATTYYFAIKTADEVPNLSSISNVVSSTTDYYFIHLSDLHVGADGAKDRLATLVRAIRSKPIQPAFVVLSGDLVDGAGTSPGTCNSSWFSDLAEVLSGLGDIEWWACPGNHDLRLVDWEGSCYKTHVYPALYYVHPIPGARLISLNAGHDWYWNQIPDCTPEAVGLGDAQVQWLRQTLSASPQLPTVVFLHNPLFNCSSGSTGCENGSIVNGRDDLLNLLCDPNGDGNWSDAVKLVLSGHTHSSAEYRRLRSGTADRLTVPAGGYLTTGAPSMEPLFITTNSAAFNSGYREIAYHAGEFRVRSNEHILDNTKAAWYMQYCHNILGSPRQRSGPEGIESTVPLRLHAYDAAGHHVGRRPDGGLDLGIPGATYWSYAVFDSLTGDSTTTGEEISTPVGSDSVRYSFKAASAATVGIEIRCDRGSGNSVALEYNDVGFSGGAVGELQVTGSSVDYGLRLDENGDGVPDRTVPPDSIATHGSPVRPVFIEQTTSGSVNEGYLFRVSLQDPEGDPVSVMFDWGVGASSGWLEPVPSGGSAGTSRSWSSPGVYLVRAVARDTSGNVGDWSDPVRVTIDGSTPVTGTHVACVIEGPGCRISWDVGESSFVVFPVERTDCAGQATTVTTVRGGPDSRHYSWLDAFSCPGTVKYSVTGVDRSGRVILLGEASVTFPAVPTTLQLTPVMIQGSSGIELTINAPITGEARIIAFDVAGRRISEATVAVTAGVPQKVTLVSLLGPNRLPNGVYLVRGSIGGYQATSKVLAMH